MMKKSYTNLDFIDNLYIQIDNAIRSVVYADVTKEIMRGYYLAHKEIADHLKDIYNDTGTISPDLSEAIYAYDMISADDSEELNQLPMYSLREFLESYVTNEVRIHIIGDSKECTVSDSFLGKIVLDLTSDFDWCEAAIDLVEEFEKEDDD